MPDGSNIPEQPKSAVALTFPTTDPTVLTTAQLDRAIASLQQTIDVRFTGFREITELQFNLIADWRLEQKDDTRVRLDAAFAAQKEAIAKQEGAIDRQLEQLRLTFQNAVEELRRGQDDNKGRIQRIESQKVGGQEATSERRNANAAVFAFAAFLGSLVIIGGFVAAMWPR